MFRSVYSLLFRILLPFIMIRLWWHGRRSPGLRKDWQHRIGLVPKMTGRVIWVHAVSVGETIAAGPMIRRLLKSNLDAQILITTMTDTGLAQARKMFGDSVSYAYAPYDTPGSVFRFIQRANPDILVIMETEIWPNMICECRRRSVPVFLVNARLSETSARGYERVKRLVSPVMKSITWIAAQAERDAERFRRIGVDPEKIEVTGSVKFDVDIPEDVRKKALALRKDLEGRFVWIAGSTHEGEDVQLLAAHRDILKRHPTALLIIAARHPERFSEVAELVVREGFSLARRSLHENPEAAEIYLADTMGELMMLYGASDAAFVGGSLIKRGGHNPLEPAAWGLPVLAGPHVFNFEVIYERLEESHGVVFVADQGQLASELCTLIEDPAARVSRGNSALAVVNKNRGALEKVIQGIGTRL